MRNSSFDRCMACTRQLHWYNDQAKTKWTPPQEVHLPATVAVPASRPRMPAHPAPPARRGRSEPRWPGPLGGLSSDVRHITRGIGTIEDARWPYGAEPNASDGESAWVR